MKSSTLRLIVPLAVIAAIGIGYVTTMGTGTLSAIGWQDISLLCPIGALGAMLASKSIIPRAVFSVLLAIAAVLLVGRAFCAWMCPVPFVQRLRGLFSRHPHDRTANTDDSKGKTRSGGCQDCKSACAASLGASGSATERVDRPSATRHIVLGGSLLSAAIFGFPVFCVICPIGLTFATIFLLVRAFGFGDASWALFAVPALLVVEVVLLRKWCHRFCPIASFMSLVGRGNRTFQPHAVESSCLESKGAVCGKCAAACPEGIDPRHRSLGAPMSECTRCQACVEACPTHALSILPLAPKAVRMQGSDLPVEDEAQEVA